MLIIVKKKMLITPLKKHNILLTDIFFEGYY